MRWLARLFRPRAIRNVPRQPRRFRPLVEILEDRLAPAVFTVNTTLDVLGGSTLSLRQAILNADATPGNNTINLAAGATYQLTLTGSTGDGTTGALFLTNNMTINGNGATINATGLGDRVLDIENPSDGSPAAVVLYGLTITGGTASRDGGGIYADSSTLTLNLNNTFVTGNHAATFGGGIYLRGTLNVTGGAIENNTAGYGGGGIYAIGSTVNLTGDTVQGNSVTNSGGPGGGGIYANGGALNFAQDSFLDNTAAYGGGGGLYVQLGSSGSLNIVSSTIQGNTAKTGGGLYANFSTSRGNIQVSLASDTFQGNTATSASGGGIYANLNTSGSSGSIHLSVANSTIQGNTAANGYGGGVYARINGSSSGSIYLSVANSAIEDNTAGYGGAGMYLTSSGGSSSLYLTNDTFQGNTATAGSGGGLYASIGGSQSLYLANDAIQGNNAGNSGGGIYSLSGSLYISSSVISGNVSNSSGGGIYNGSGSLYLTNDTIQGNNAKNGSGGGIYKGSGSGTVTSDTIDGNTASYGGGIFNSSDGTVTLLSSLIAANIASSGPDLKGIFAAGDGGKGYNLIGVLDGTATYTKGANDQGATTTPLTAAQIGLGPLQNNGGLTFTQGLLATSLANKNGFINSAVTTDQRGFPRSATTPSIGAFEPQPINAALGTNANAVYVENLYETLLDRTADAGAAYWVNQLNAGTPGSSVVQGIEGSTEYLNDLVANLYQHYLRRAPDSGGQYWVRLLAGGDTIEQIIVGITTSTPEYFDLHGGSNQGFVTGLYLDILNRSPDSAGLNYFVGQLNAGASPASVVAAFLSTQEYRTDLVESYYLNYLGRAADSGGLNYFVGQLNAGVADQVVLAALLGSGEAFGNRS